MPHVELYRPTATQSAQISARKYLYFVELGSVKSMVHRANIGELGPDRVEEIRDLVMRQLINQWQNPVSNRLCRHW